MWFFFFILILQKFILIKFEETLSNYILQWVIQYYTCFTTTGNLYLSNNQIRNDDKV